MTGPAALACWKCGAALDSVPLPIGRLAECPDCSADLHVCRLCELYDPGVAKHCREPIAEEVNDKERANFCEYFEPTERAGVARDDGERAAARAGLADLFGAGSVDALEPAAERKRKEQSQAKDALDALFGLDPDREP